MCFVKGLPRGLRRGGGILTGFSILRTVSSNSDRLLYYSVLGSQFCSPQEMLAASPGVSSGAHGVVLTPGQESHVRAPSSLGSSPAV